MRQRDVERDSVRTLAHEHVGCSGRFMEEPTDDLTNVLIIIIIN